MFIREDYLVFHQMLFSAWAKYSDEDIERSVIINACMYVIFNQGNVTTWCGRFAYCPRTLKERDNIETLKIISSIYTNSELDGFPQQVFPDQSQISTDFVDL